MTGKREKRSLTIEQQSRQGTYDTIHGTDWSERQRQMEKQCVCVCVSIEEVECSVYVRQKTHTFGTNKSNQKFSSSVSLMGQTISNEWVMLRTPYGSGVWCLCVRKKMNGYVLLWWTIDKYHNRNLHIAIIWKRTFFHTRNTHSMAHTLTLCGKICE